MSITNGMEVQLSKVNMGLTMSASIYRSSRVWLTYLLWTHSSISSDDVSPNAK